MNKDKFTVYFSQRELNALRKDAKDNDLTISDLLRRIIDDKYDLINSPKINKS